MVAGRENQVNAITTEEWGRRYAAHRPKCEELANRVRNLVVDILESHRIDVIQVESRTKTVDSFLDKIRRKDPGDGNPLDSVTDLVGVRVITYYLDDVERVGELLSNEFDVDHKNSMDKTGDMAINQFGYRSNHYVMKLSPARAGLIEWKSYAGMPVEVQVRTSLQHAWAAVSHKLAYKNPEDAPIQLQRRLFRLSALFELADEQFATLRDDGHATDVASREEVSAGRLDIPVDASTLVAYLEESPHASALAGMLDQSGLVVLTELEPSRLAQDRSDLLAVMRAFDLQTVRDLDRLLSDQGRLNSLVRALEHELKEFGIGGLEDWITQIIIIEFDRSDEPGKAIYNSQVIELLRRARDRVLNDAAKANAGD